MAETLPRHYFMGIIIFTLFIAGGMAMIGYMRAEDATYGDNTKLQEFNKTFNVIDEITITVGGIERNIEGSEQGGLDSTILGRLISTSWRFLSLMFSSLSFMDAVFNGFSSFFGIPQWVSGLIQLMVTVMLGFAIYSAIFQREI